jgi:hypothetical protein
MRTRSSAGGRSKSTCHFRLTYAQNLTENVRTIHLNIWYNNVIRFARLFAPAVCHLCKLMYWTKCFVSWRTNLTYMTSLIAKDYFS